MEIKMQFFGGLANLWLERALPISDQWEVNLGAIWRSGELQEIFGASDPNDEERLTPGVHEM